MMYCVAHVVMKWCNVLYSDGNLGRTCICLPPYLPPAVTNPCAVANGGCEYMCLLSAVEESGYSCACPTGHLLHDDGRHCLGEGHATLLKTHMKLLIPFLTLHLSPSLTLPSHLFPLTSSLYSISLPSPLSSSPSPSLIFSLSLSPSLSLPLSLSPSLSLPRAGDVPPAHRQR